MDTIWKDRVWLALALGPFAWAAVFSPWVDWSSLSSVGILIIVSFCLNLNLGIVSLCVPWPERKQPPTGE